MSECNAALANFLEAKGLISVLPFDSSKTAGVQLKNLSAVKMHEFIRDALEILSPGPLPKGMTVAKLHKRHQSLPTNPLLAQAMFFRGYIEKVGSGTRDMIDRCREWGIEPPRWEDDEGDFAVVLRRPTALETTLHTTVASRDVG